MRAACDALGTAQASYYRRHRTRPAPARPAPVAHRDRPQPRALSAAEQQAVLRELHSARFADMAPAEVWAILLDERRYLGSISTFYRLLRRAGETNERRRQATHPATVKPELVANGVRPGFRPTMSPPLGMRLTRAQGTEHPRVRILDPSEPLPPEATTVERKVLSLPNYPWQRSTYATRSIAGND